MTSEMLEVLRQYPFVEEFHPEHIDRLTMLASEVRFEPGQVIFREGDECSLFFVILSGSIALEADLAGRTFRVQTLYPGDELGWSAVLNHKKEFRARALEEVSAMSFEASRLWQAVKDDPCFGCAFFYRMFTVVARRLQGTRYQLMAALAEAGPPK